MIDSQNVISRIDSIGTVPTSVAQVFSLINDPKATLLDFERVVRPDMGLTANLLRCANSAYYRGTREITSVKEAISRMGMRRVFEVVAGASFAKTIPSKLLGYDVDAETYWTHSVAVGVLADRIGREVGFTYPDLAFTAGLLHDLGKAVIASYFAGPGSMRLATIKPEHLGTLEGELALLGTDHGQLGEVLAVKWNLPKEIAGGARWHHCPENAPTATLRYLATVIQVADALAHASGYGEGDEVAAPIDPAALERLNLDPADLTALVEEARKDITQTSEMLRSAARS